MRSPAFQFYPKDWLTDEQVQIMTPMEEWCYFRMVLYCYEYDSLPAEPETIALIVGKGASTTLVAPLKRMFFSDPNNPSRIRHKRVDKEREKQKQWSEKSKLGGKRSGIARRNFLKGGSRVVGKCLNSSSSPPGEEKKEMPASRISSSPENGKPVTTKSLLDYLKPNPDPEPECPAPLSQ